MKRNLVFTLILTCTLILLTACGGHSHSASSNWTCDLENHWHTCECGEQLDYAAHTIEDDICTVCGSEIAHFEDGSALLITYNEHGDCTQVASYTADGSLDSEELTEYTYDADGNMLSQKTTLNGVPTFESEYALNDSGETYLIKESFYYEDGARDVSEYDENQNLLRSCAYDSDGNVLYASEYEYSLEANWMGEKLYEGDLLISEQEYLLDEDGIQTTIRSVYYNEDGSSSVTEYDEHGNEILSGSYDAEGHAENLVRYENEYDAEGNQTLRRTYEGDRLTEEMEFWFGSDEDGSWSMSGKTTTYHEDGTKTVSDRDLDATWSSEITYDANGNVIEEIRYEYLYNNNGDSVGSKGYKNGKLFKEAQSIIDSDGETTGILMIDYAEDGTKTVSEYNEVFDLVKQTVYDASGAVISES